MADVVIVDYGMGNLRSVSKALEATGATVVISEDAEQVAKADRLVLPGVGAFEDAMIALRRRGMDAAVRDFVATGRPFLGICLGLQLLFEIGLEDGEHQGLGILPGKCIPLPADLHDADGRRLKIPHMGWNSLVIHRRAPIYDGLAEGADVYFVHSYVVAPSDAAIASTWTDYGQRFVSSVWHENIMAVQFHPEKSQQVGLTMLRNFVATK